MPVHPQVQTMLDAMAALGLPPVNELDVPAARERMAAMRASRPVPPPEPVSAQDVSIPRGDGSSIPARRYTPENGGGGVVVYYHGGGWVIGTLDDYDSTCKRMARVSGCEVLSVDYRLAPEHAFPAAAEDAYTALRWAAEQFEGHPLAVAGDSAGGNLAAVAALQARDRGGPELALQVLVYPVTDYDLDTESYRANGGGEYMLSTASMDWFWNHYVPNVADRRDPLVSPLQADDLSGLAPAVVLVAEYDPLHDEGVAYAKRLEEAGVPVVLHRYPGMIHGFFGMLGMLDDSDAAAELVGDAIRTAVANAATTRVG